MDYFLIGDVYFGEEFKVYVKAKNLTASYPNIDPTSNCLVQAKVKLFKPLEKSLTTKSLGKMIQASPTGKGIFIWYEDLSKLSLTDRLAAINHCQHLVIGCLIGIIREMKQQIPYIYQAWYVMKSLVESLFPGSLTSILDPCTAFFRADDPESAEKEDPRSGRMGKFMLDCIMDDYLADVRMHNLSHLLFTLREDILDYHMGLESKVVRHSGNIDVFGFDDFLVQTIQAASSSYPNPSVDYAHLVFQSHAQNYYNQICRFCRKTGSKVGWVNCEHCSVHYCSNDCRVAHRRGHTLSCASGPGVAGGQTCGHCLRVKPEMSGVCGGCQVVHYCDRACQRLHWKTGHKKECVSQTKDG